MALEEIVSNQIKVYGGASWKFEKIEEEPEKERKYQSEDVDLFLAYSEHPVTPEERALIHKTPERELDSALNEELPNVKGRAYEKLINIVSPNYENLLSEMGVEQLAYAVDNTETENVGGNEEYNVIVEARKSYKTWEKAEKEGNVDFYRENVRNPILAKAVAIASNAEVKPLMPGKVNIERNRFLASFVSDGNFDVSKFKEYLNTAVGSTEEVAKSAYVNMGKAYAVVQARE